MNHTFTSHVSTLSYYLNVKENKFRSADLSQAIENTKLYIDTAINLLQSPGNFILKPDKKALEKLNEQTEALLDKRKQEIAIGQFETKTKSLLVEVKSVTDQFTYIFKVAADISKSCKEIKI